MSAVFVTNYNDWEGIYLDGKLVDQGHSLDLVQTLKRLGIDVRVVEPSHDWLMSRGRLPDTLDEVVERPR